MLSKLSAIHNLWHKNNMKTYQMQQTYKQSSNRIKKNKASIQSLDTMRRIASPYETKLSDANIFFLL